MMKTFILVFGSIFLLIVSSCTPVTQGASNTHPIKVAFAEDISELESVNVVVGKIVYVQIEQPSGFFDFSKRQLDNLDEQLSNIGRRTKENNILVTEASSWFTLVDYQLLYSANDELVLVDDEDWSIKLKKTIARRKIERVNKIQPRNVNIRYSEWFDFVFAITPDNKASGDYVVVVNVKLQGSAELGKVVLRFKAPSNDIPQNTPEESNSDLAS